MSDAQNSTTELLDSRYGRGKQRGIDRKFAWITAGTLVVAGLLFVLFSGWHLTSDLEYKDLAYEVVDDRTVQVDAQVTAPESSTVLCAVEAMSTSYAVVGWKIVELPAGQDRTRRFETTMVTTSPATTGTVRECWVKEPEK